MFKKNTFLFISLFLHLIVIYVVAQSVMFPSLPDSVQEKSNVIQATLFFDLPNPPTEMPAEEPEVQKTITEIPADNSIEPIQKPKAPIDSVTPEPAVMLSQETLVQETLPKITSPQPEEEEVQKAEQNDSAGDIVPEIQTTVPTTNLELSAPATSMARRHLRSFQQQQQNRAAEQAARYYQQNKNSPIIDGEIKQPFATETEKFMQQQSVKANCSGATRATAAALIGFLGGAVDCSKPPPISGFIQDRLNKKSSLPSHQIQEEQKRPQSVVIKKQP